MAAVLESPRTLELALVEPGATVSIPDEPDDATPLRPSRFARRLTLIFAAIFAVVVASGLLADHVIRDFVDQSEQVALTVETKDQLARLVSALKDAEANQRSYLLTGQPVHLAAFIEQVSEVGERIGALEHSRLDDLPRDRLQELDARVHDYVASLNAAVHARTGADGTDGDGVATDATMQVFAVSDAALEDMRAITLTVDAMRAQLDAEIARHSAATNTTASRLRLFGPIAMTGFLVLVAAVFRTMFHAYRKRLRAEHDLNRSYVELADSLMEARTLAEQVRRLSELGELLQSSNSIAEAMHVCATVLPGILPDCAGNVYLINASNNLLEHIGGFGDHELPYEVAFAPDDCWAIRRGQPFPPPEGTQFRCGHTSKDASHHGTLCIPLAAQNEALGTLSLEVRGAVPAELRRAARSVAEQLSLALANLRLRETLRTQSVRDPLTGLFNRRYLEVSFARELVRAQRREASVAVLMIDVDHFKRFNDTHGHEAGDAVLAAVGQTLSRLTRGEDIACRYGGEEFAVLLSEAGVEVALRRAEELRVAISQLQLEHRRVSLGGLSISLGVAVSPQHGNDLDTLLHAADRALYRAKDSGRNRVVMAG